MSKVTAGIMKINQELDKISGLDGIVADKIGQLEVYVKSMVSRILDVMKKIDDAKKPRLTDAEIEIVMRALSGKPIANKVEQILRH